MPTLTLQQGRRERRLARDNMEVCDAVATAIETELNWLAIAVTGDTLLGVVFGYATRKEAENALRRALKQTDGNLEFIVEQDTRRQNGLLADLAERLERYAAGEPVDFSDVRVDESHLTPFGKRIVAACRRIGWGSRRSYGELAVECGSAGAARAVGQVMAKNRFPLVVPCHRVLGAGGSLGGFSAPEGLRMKRRLLDLEGRKNL